MTITETLESKDFNELTEPVNRVERQRNKKKKLLVYLRKSTLSPCVMTDSFKDLGFKIEILESSYLLTFQNRIVCDLFWCGCDNDYYSVEIPAKLQNRIPGMRVACKKGQMCQVVNVMQLLFPKNFNFLPKSWPIPSQYAAFCHYVFTGNRKNEYYILKPDEGSQGDGIYLFKNPTDIPQGTLLRNSVVQQYVGNPLLIDGYKFDLRLYVLIAQLDPLEAFLCTEGLARFCTEKYEKPTLKNLSKSYMHLTNYSLNKHSVDFIVSEEDSTGSKRTLSSVMEILKVEGYDTDILWDRIVDVVFKTLICITPLTKVEQLNNPTTENNQFHILGFDILIDEDLNTYLLEINGYPSMKTDHETFDEKCKKTVTPSPVDHRVKKTVLTGAFSILFKKEIPGSYITIIDSEIDDSKKNFLIFEDCRRLFVLFLKKHPSKKSSLLGSTGFRAFVRSCQITDAMPNFTNADLDLLFINICQQGESGSMRSLSFLAFYRVLLYLAEKKYPHKTSFHGLRNFVDLCFCNYESYAATHH